MSQRHNLMQSYPPKLEWSPVLITPQKGEMSLEELHTETIESCYTLASRLPRDIVLTHSLAKMKNRNDIY